MTTITFHLSRAIRRLLAEGDEIIVTRLDHDANIAPWLALQQTGIEIRWLEFEPESCTLRLEQLAELISPRTKLIAAGYASNAVGTINDVPRIVELAKAAGVMTYIDAVHFAPHGLIDVQALGCDFLVCSAYKFFGPHLGVACIRPAIAEKLMPDRVRPQHPEHPEKFETGTLNHEGLAGLIAAIDYIASLSFEQTGESRRQRISRAMQLVSRYEKSLSQILIQGLQLLPGVTIHGITDLDNPGARTPTVSITVEGRHALEVARALGQKGVFVWDGDFYAVEVVRALHLEAIGGLIRIGLTHYNTPAEIERFLQKLTQILA